MTLAEAKSKLQFLERPKSFRTFAVLFIVVVFFLSLLSVIFYFNAEDYRGAKYRSQSAIVTSMTAKLSEIVSNLERVVNEGDVNSMRANNAMISYYDLEYVTDCSDFVMSQYHRYDLQESAFRILRDALSNLAIALLTANEELGAQPDTETGYHLNGTMSGGIVTCIPLLQELHDEFGRALGHDNVSRYDENPSSVVDAMDLEFVQDEARAIMSAIGVGYI